MLNFEQITTIKRLAIAGILFFLWLIYLLIIEILGIKQGHNSTISEVTWILWAEQPWVIWLVSILINSVVFFLMGHFVGQSNSLYQRLIR